MITIPTLNDLYTSIKADLEAEMGVSISLIGKVFLRATASVQAAKLKLYYLAIANLQKNIFVDTAEPESMGGTLERFGRVKIGRNPFAAVAGQYTLTVTGTLGATIPGQTLFKSDDTSASPGYLFILDSSHTLAGSTDTITVRALTPGTDSKLDVLNTLSPTAPIALVNSGPASVYVSAIVVQPLAAEDTEEYREEVLNSYRMEPQGGAATDYRLWSQDAQGVEQVYPYAKSGSPCEIDLYVEATIADSTDGKGTPSQSILDDVEDVVEFNPDTTLALNERGRRPLQVVVNFLPITVKEIGITITGFTGVTAAQKTLLLSAFTAAISEIRPFVSGADILSDKNDILDTNKLIGIIVSAIPGAVFTTVSFTVDGVSKSTFTFTDGYIPNLNTVTYV
ncbi:MAG: hypothetical protein K0S44_214 [Bacteroidetes bacterium]|jgi:hypothetical protein|nr:hypothetical protein [Bacteroidota bacterium]